MTLSVDQTGCNIQAKPVSWISKNRATLAVTAGVVLCLAGLFSFNTVREARQRGSLAGNQRPPAQVSLFTVAPTELEQSLSAVGSLVAIRQVTVSSEVSGQVTRLDFSGGEAVKSGDVLVQMNDASEQAELTSLLALQNQADLALRRAVELQRNGNISDAQVDQARSQFEVARASAARTRTQIEKKRVRAPFGGSLGIRNVNLGEYLAPGQAITSLTDLERLHVNLSVPEQDRPKLAVGQPITLSVDAYADRAFEGRVMVIDPQIDPNTRTIRVQGEFANPDHALQPGMYGRAVVGLPPRTNVLTVPETAVGNSLYGDFVFVATELSADGKTKLIAKRRQVASGERAGGRIAIIDGLKAGERVVATGLTKVNDGSEIAVTARAESNDQTKQ